MIQRVIQPCVMPHIILCFVFFVCVLTWTSMYWQMTHVLRWQTNSQEVFLANDFLCTVREHRKRKTRAFAAGASSPLRVFPLACVTRKKHNRHLLCRLGMSCDVLSIRAVTKISIWWVNTTSRWGIKQLGISFGSIFIVFSYERSQLGPCS